MIAEPAKGQEQKEVDQARGSHEGPPLCFPPLKNLADNRPFLGPDQNTTKTLRLSIMSSSTEPESESETEQEDGDKRVRRRRLVVPTERRRQRDQPRKVRFSSCVQIRHVERITAMKDLSRGTVFCAQREINSYRVNAIRIARQVFRDEQDAADTQAYSYTMCEAYDLCRHAGQLSELPKQLRSNFQNWVQKGDDRRGIERWCIPDLETDQEEMRGKAVKSVLRMQEREMQQHTENISKEEVIARVYQSMSQQATLFANLLAEADAIAAKREYGTNQNKTLQKGKDSQTSLRNLLDREISKRMMRVKKKNSMDKASIDGKSTSNSVKKTIDREATKDNKHKSDPEPPKLETNKARDKNETSANNKIRKMLQKISPKRRR